MSVTRFQLQLAKYALDCGEVISYPTETVLGLGCDPDNESALQKLLRIKNRDPSKGLILVTASIEQLQPWVDFTFVKDTETIFKSWPGPETWVMPARHSVSQLITGSQPFDQSHRGIAVRVSASTTIQKLCHTFGGAIVSTSANISRRPVAKTMLSCRKLFQSEVGFYLNSDDSKSYTPTRIRNSITAEVIRNG